MTPIPCLLCRRDTDTQTCPRCLNRIRGDLNTVADLYALLPAELSGHGAAASPPDLTGVRGNDGHLLDAFVLLSAGTVAVPLASRQGDRTHLADQLASDPPSVVAVLATWEDDWRQCRQMRPAMHSATVTNTTLFLQDNLTWAAAKHPAFDEYAADVQSLRWKLESVMRIRLTRDTGYIACPDCEGELRRCWRAPDPCIHDGPHGGQAAHNQGGRQDHWHCRCGRVVQYAEYWHGVYAALDAKQAETAVT